MGEPVLLVLLEKLKIVKLDHRQLEEEIPLFTCSAFQLRLGKLGRDAKSGNLTDDYVLENTRFGEG